MGVEQKMHKRLFLTEEPFYEVNDRQNYDVGLICRYLLFPFFSLERHRGFPVS
jgi:hypothetical protein